MADLFENCSIGAGINIPCQFNPTAGTDDILILLNFDKVQKPFTFSTLKDNVVTAITRKFGGEGFAFRGRNNSIQNTATSEQGTFKPNQSHMVSFQAFGDNPEISKTLDELKFAKVIGLLQTANGWYKINGENGGLILTSDTFDTNNEDNGGGHVIELTATKEKRNPLYLALSYDNTDITNPTFNETTTEALFLGLLDPVTIAVTGITAGIAPVITVASTAELSTGMNVMFKNITWTTNPTSGDTLNDEAFTIEVINATTFRITAGASTPTPTFNTTGGTYGSGGTIQLYRA